MICPGGTPRCPCLIPRHWFLLRLCKTTPPIRLYLPDTHRGNTHIPKTSQDALQGFLREVMQAEETAAKRTGLYDLNRGGSFLIIPCGGERPDPERGRMRYRLSGGISPQKTRNSLTYIHRILYSLSDTILHSTVPPMTGRPVVEREMACELLRFARRYNMSQRACIPSGSAIRSAPGRLFVFLPKACHYIEIRGTTYAQSVTSWFRERLKDFGANSISRPSNRRRTRKALK